MATFECSECGKVLKNENTLRDHMNRHIGMFALHWEDIYRLRPGFFNLMCGLGKVANI